MTNQEPLDPQDLDLIAAFASGDVTSEEASRAQQLIASDNRFADEHAAQLLAISTLDEMSFEPLTDIERMRLKQAVRSEFTTATATKTWSQRALTPLSIAAVLVVVVGFVGMRNTPSDLASSDTAAASQLEEAAFDAEMAEEGLESQSQTTESPAATLAPTEAADMFETDGTDEAMAEESSPATKLIAVEPPDTGDLKPITLNRVEGVDELLPFAQWTSPVALDRYPSLTCWADEGETVILGAALVEVGETEYEVVATDTQLEARLIETCAATVILNE